jgi:hypothetical protein
MVVISLLIFLTGGLSILPGLTTDLTFFEGKSLYVTLDPLHPWYMTSGVVTWIGDWSSLSHLNCDVKSILISPFLALVISFVFGFD